MSTCSCAVHVTYTILIHAVNSQILPNFTDFHTLTHATHSYALLLQPIIAVRLFTSDIFHSCYSVACLLHTNYCFICIPPLFTIWSLVDVRRI